MADINGVVIKAPGEHNHEIHGPIETLSVKANSKIRVDAKVI